MTPEEKDAEIKRLTKQIQDNAEKNDFKISEKQKYSRN